MNVHPFFDARGADPTGTAGIRRSFRAAGKLRMRMFRSQMRQAVVDHDVLGLGGGGLALQPPETRLQAFNGWARVAAEQALGGPWLSQWIARAWASGEAVGALQTRSEAPGEGSGAWEELAKIELQSIQAAVIQALMREAAVALTKRRANKTVTWRRMAKAFDKVGPRRVMALANTFCVACHNRGRLAAYRAAGITKVGVIAERLLPKQSLLLPGGLGDASAQSAYASAQSALDAKHKGYRTRAPARPEYELGEVEEPIEVGVRTAEDEFVCIECDAFAANSPHDIDDVEDTLPIHPNCRCTWYPWDDRRFRHDAAIEDERKKTKREELLERLGRKRHRLLASLCPRTFKNRFLKEDAWNPNQPREPAGTSEGGQFASITGGGISGGATGGPAKKLFTPSTDKAHHEKRVSDTLLNPVKRNDNYRYIVGQLVKEAKGHGASVDTIAALRTKIGESFYKQGLVKKEKGAEDQAQSMFAKGKSYGYQPTPQEFEAANKPASSVAEAIASLMAAPEIAAAEKAHAEEIAAKPPSAATIPVASPTWTKVGGQAGSVAGGFYKDPSGNNWYVKTPKTEAHVNADLLSNSLYKLAGVPVSDEVKTVLGGKPAVASKIIEGTKTLSQASSTSESIDAYNKLKEGFAVDAWLGNRDVIGEGFDNVLIGHAVPYRIDQGGTLMYRAQGETKEFGPAADEITSMRSTKINPQTASVFGSMTDAEVSASIDKVLAIPDFSIAKLVKEHGLGSELAATLIARKQWLEAYKKALDYKASPKPSIGEGEPQLAWMAAMEAKDPPAKQAAQPKPTAAELEKAKKVGPYYPAPESAAGKAIVAKFNEKWATKTPQPEELEQKVAEYKVTKAALESFQQQEAAAQEAANAAAKKEAAAKLKAEKAAAKAKEEAESAKHQAAIAQIAAELGLTPNDADQVDTLIQLAGGDAGKIVQQFKAFQESGKGKHGLPISPFESAMIQSYVGSAYGHANRQLREGVWDMKTHVFAAAIQKALAKLPAYNEQLKRGFSAKQSEQSQYEVGKIVHWNAFSSCGKSSSFSGNMQCTITPLKGNGTRARDLGPMNPNEAGGEVLYMAKSSFKVTKVQGSPGNSMHVWLDEVESF